ncbi:MAG: hypothetical protein AAGI50_11350 [Pseudomonadota bacterium]
MTTPAILALIGILAGTLCLVLRRAEIRRPDPDDTEFPSALADALTGAIAWIAVVPMIATFAILVGPVAGGAVAAALALALFVPTGARLIPFYRARIPLAATSLLLSVLSGMSIVTGFMPGPETP